MVDMQELYRTIDALNREEAKQLYEYLEQRRRSTWWIVPEENLAALQELLRPVLAEAARMSDEEIEDVLNAALDYRVSELFTKQIRIAF